LIDFAAERQRHVRFLGREDVLGQLDEWLDGPSETGWVVVTGGPGMGKSAILSAWLARRGTQAPHSMLRRAWRRVTSWLVRREAASTVVVHHFIRRQVADWDQPEVIAASLAAQIEAAFPKVREAKVKPERRLLELLGRVSKQLGTKRRLVVVVDGLDETRANRSENPLPRFLPHVVPMGIRFLCATRPTYPHLNWIEARSPVRRLDLDDPRWALSNETVIRGFWEAVASEYQPPMSAETMAAAIARAEGNVLHAVMLHDALRDLPSKERRAGRIPRGLKELVGEAWNQAASHETVRVGLGLLCAAQESLSLDMLAEVTGWSYDDKQHFVRDARQLLLEELVSWAGVEAYRPRHEWVRELIAERIGAATIRAHHATLSRTLATWSSRSEAAERRYALCHALTHRAEAGAWTDAWQLAANMSFLEAKCRELGVHETEVDVARMAERSRASGDAVVCQRFRDLARALARESHWLRVAPEATAALIWNRLRQWKWSAGDIDRQLRVPAEATFLRVRHIEIRESPALIRNLVGHSDYVNACAVTADGRRVVSASSDKTLKVWDLESGRALVTLDGHANSVNACAVTPDGQRVVSASDDGTLNVWDVESGRILATLRGCVSRATACAVTADGHRVVSGSDDGTLELWDIEGGHVLATLEGHAGRVNACVLTADGRCVVSASDDGTLKLWDVENKCVLATLEGHAGRVNACVLTADGRRVVSASDDGTLKLWDVESGHAVATLKGHTGPVNACALRADGRRMVSASDDGTLNVWNLESGRAFGTLEGHAGCVNACALVADGRRMVSASHRTLKIWDLGNEETLRRAILEPIAGSLRACAVTADGRRVVLASPGRAPKVCDPENGRTLATLESHAGGVSACAVTADGCRVVSASYDGTLRIWDLESGRTLAALEGHTAGVIACAVSADSRCAVSASEDKTLTVWDLESGRVLATLEGHTGKVTACAMTADGRRVVSASEDKTLKVWSLESGRTLATLEGHTGKVTACAVTADGRRVVSASEDETLKVWDLESRRALATLEGHTSGVTACAVTVDGRRVVSASWDWTLRVWDLETHACLFIHRGDAHYHIVAASVTVIVAGDTRGGVWFLEWPQEMTRPA
jgi:WD40 repeat protein